MYSCFVVSMRAMDKAQCIHFFGYGYLVVAKIYKLAYTGLNVVIFRYNENKMGQNVLTITRFVNVLKIWYRQENDHCILLCVFFRSMF